MRKIEFGEFRINESSKKHLQDCIDSNWISMGKKVSLLEGKWRGLFNYGYARAVSSGTSAVTACCMALYDFGAKPGDEIIVPALTFIASATAIRAAGFTPRFVDVKTDMNIDESLIQENINEKTRAIVAVNLMGKPAALDIIQSIARNNGLKVIIDACESYGCKYRGKFALEYGDMETSSHYVAHLIVCGEGGIVSTNDPQLDEVIESIRSHGRVKGSLYFDHVRYGLNFKMSDLHASIGLGEVEQFWDVFWKRKSNVQYLRNCCAGLEDIAWFTEEEADCVNCPHGFSITLKPKYKDKIDQFKKHLDDSNIHWKRNFGTIVGHKSFSYLNLDQNLFPNALYIGDFGIHVGCHYWLTDDELEYLGSKLRDFLVKL